MNDKTVKVTDEMLTSLFDWDKVETDRDGIILFARFDRTNQTVKESVSRWIHRIAMEEQWGKEIKDPIARRQSIYDAFTLRLEAMRDYITSEAAGVNRMELARAKLTGNGGIAGAYKKIGQAILKGGDLRQLGTANACQQYVTAQNKENDAAETAKRRRDEAMLDAIDNGFKMAGTEDELKLFEGEVERLIQKSLREATAAALASDNTNTPVAAVGGPQDKFDLMGQEVANVLRNLHEDKLAEFADDKERDASETADKNVQDQLEKILRNLTKLCESSQTALAASSGLTEDVAQAS